MVVFFCDAPFGEDDSCPDTFASEDERYAHYLTEHPEWEMKPPPLNPLTRPRKDHRETVTIDVRRHPEFFPDGIIPNYEAKDCWVCGARVSVDKGHMDIDKESGKFRVMHPGCVERLPREPMPFTKESAIIFGFFLLLFLVAIVFF